jgi:Cdc6-like AAA superfamily ATPase
MKAYKLETVDDVINHYEKLATKLGQDPSGIRADIEHRHGLALRRLEDKIPEMYKNADLAELGYVGDDLWDMVKELFSDVDGSAKGIFITGSAGCGKTYASYAIWRKLMSIDTQKCVLFKNYAELFQDIRDEFVNSASYHESGSVWDILTNGREHPGLVIIDDLGTSKFSDFELEKLFLILEKRITDYEPLIITANIADDVVLKERFGDRIGSRLGMLKRFKFPDVDLREDDEVTEEVA